MNITESICFKFAKIIKLKRCLIDIKMKKLRLSRTQWQVALWLKIFCPCTQKELLINMDIDAGHLARVLDEFEKNKYIVRTPLKDDRRALYIEVTKLCRRQLMPQLEKILEEENAIFIEGLTSAEQEFLSRTLKKIEENMEIKLQTRIARESNEY